MVAASGHQGLWSEACDPHAHCSLCPGASGWLSPQACALADPSASPTVTPPTQPPTPLRPESTRQLLRDTLLTGPCKPVPTSSHPIGGHAHSHGNAHPPSPGPAERQRACSKPHTTARGHAPPPASPPRRQDGRLREAKPFTPGHTAEKPGDLAPGPSRRVRGGKTCLTLVAAPEPRPPSERSWASLPSGPWVRWPVGTSPNWAQSSCPPCPHQAEPSPAGAGRPPGSSGCCPRTAAPQPDSLQGEGKGCHRHRQPLPHGGGWHRPSSRRLQGRGTRLCPQTDPQMAWSSCDTETQRGLDTGEWSRWTQGQLQGGRTPSTGTTQGCVLCPRGQAGDHVSRLPSTARQVPLGVTVRQHLQPTASPPPAMASSSTDVAS